MDSETVFFTECQDLEAGSTGLDKDPDGRLSPVGRHQLLQQFQPGHRIHAKVDCFGRRRHVQNRLDPGVAGERFGSQQNERHVVCSADSVARTELWQTHGPELGLQTVTLLPAPCSLATSRCTIGFRSKLPTTHHLLVAKSAPAFPPAIVRSAAPTIRLGPSHAACRASDSATQPVQCSHRAPICSEPPRPRGGTDAPRGPNNALNLVRTTRTRTRPHHIHTRVPASREVHRQLTLCAVGSAQAQVRHRACRAVWITQGLRAAHARRRADSRGTSR
eukprot:SAG31_NODE_2467_length_5652_cov_3.221862_1_plen_276_part_00